MSKFMFGADPETFIIDARKDIVLPAYFFYPDTGKGNCADLGVIGGCHSDNVMLEFNPAPSTNFLDVVENVHRCIESAHNRIYDLARNKQTGMKYNIDPDRLAIRAKSYYDIMDKQLPHLYGDHPKFFEFGCEPDFNAYTRDKNKSPDLPQNARVAGGHIMISALDERLNDPEIIINAVRWMDVLVSPVIMSAIVESGGSLLSTITRRAYYGKSGSFRPKKFPNGFYGIEYRTPGPEWITLGMGARARVALRKVEIALIRSVENAMEFKQCPIEQKVVTSAVDNGNMDAIIELLEAANYV